jgi:hypothetical protein
MKTIPAILAALAVAITLVGGASPTPAAAAPPDNAGPACTDIKGRDGNYTTTAAGHEGNAFFTFSFTILAAPCKNASYTLHVTDSNGGTINASYPDGGLTLCAPTQFCFTHDYGAAAGAPTVLTITADSTIGGHLADTTPPAEYLLDGPPGDNSWDQ